MSDVKLTEYFGDGDSIGLWPTRSCLNCGAMIGSAYLGLHAEWHERQQSTEQLILSNLSLPAYLMDPDRGGEPHGG